MEQEDIIFSIYLRIDQIYRELTMHRPLRRGGFVRPIPADRQSG